MSSKQHFVLNRFQAVWLLLLWVVSSTQAGQSWSVVSSVAYNSGYYIYNETIENYYISLGARYRASDWMISASVPFLRQKDNVGFALGDSTAESTGLGDLYLFGEKTVWKSIRKRSTISINGQLKIPHGLSEANFTSNATDAGLGLNFRRSWGYTNIFANAGYLMLGDPPGIEYADPITYGLGVGRFLLKGRVSASLYYKAYTQILEGIIPPKQLSFGLTTKFTNTSFISLYLSKGLSESSPDYSVSLGVSAGL